MAKNTTDYLQFGIDPELKEKVNKYCEIKGNSKNDLFYNLLTEFFNNKIVSNDFIKLAKPYYFNIQDLLNNKCVIATTDKPTNKFNDYIKVVNIPNNLDSYNKKYKTYCYEQPETHKGILINCFINKDYNELFINYLGFEYKQNNYYNDPFFKASENTLKINLLNENELLNFLDISKDKEILKELNTKEKEIKEAISKDNNTFECLKEKEKEIKKAITKDKETRNNFIENNFKVALFKSHWIKENEYKLTDPVLLMDKENNILFGNMLIKSFDNYFYLRPFYIDKFINDLIYLMQENKEIYNYIATSFKIDIDKLKEYQESYIFDIRIFNLIRNLYHDIDNFININVLLDAHINNKSISKALIEHRELYNYNKDSLFNLIL